MKEFTPIAMRCTQEQFEAIKPRLNNCEILNIGSFNTYFFLTNYYCSKENEVSNITKASSKDRNRKVYEEWNEEVFLKSCGIEVEKPKTKENVYISLVGKSEEELTELYWILKNNNQDFFHVDLSVFIKEYYQTDRFLEYYNNKWGGGNNLKQEITIQELKEMLQPATLEQQLEEAQRQVKHLQYLIEENKPKVGDWVISENKRCYIKIETDLDKKLNWKKITNQTLIKLLENEI